MSLTNCCSQELKASSFVLLIGLLFSSLTTYADDKKSLVFGVHPFKKPSKTYLMFLPLVEYLSKELDRDIKLVIGKNYEDIIHKHHAGQVHFGYFGPASYAVTSKDTKLFPLARIMMNGRGAFKGVIVARTDSAINSIDDIRGKHFAFGDKESTLSHYIPHYMLMQNSIGLKDLSRYSFTGNHDNVALNVLNGQYDAGGLKPQVARQYLDKGLKIVAQSEWVPEHLFAANQHMDNDTRKQIQTALLRTDLKILQAIKSSITGIEMAKDQDYDQLRKIIEEVDKDPL
ncbi:MAG: phosphate/phosphite/phosphonate ABC transporter substrate-binding protein [Gammaproteobacteria bacterium]|nr:phosphate/phosphite/phosphonate ABC transporter substrate-binding protein [Gammaproteobacteria bacterium]